MGSKRTSGSAVTTVAMLVLGALFTASRTPAEELGVLALAQAAEEPAQAESAPTRTEKGGLKVQNEALRQHLIDNVDIFGKSDLSAIYILGPGMEDFQGQLLVRDFARDPFFMQNIDREEFELKMILRDFEPDQDDDSEDR